MTGENKSDTEYLTTSQQASICFDVYWACHAHTDHTTTGMLRVFFGFLFYLTLTLCMLARKLSQTHPKSSKLQEVRTAEGSHPS